MRTKPEPRRSLRWLAVWLVGATGFLGCGDDARTVRGIGGSALPPNGTPEACAVPARGCPCEEEGETVDCGETLASEGDVVTCSMGRRTCEDGSWSACSSSRLEQKSLRTRSFGYHTLGQGDRGPCPTDYENIACDPYCYAQVDEPDDDLDLPPNFDVTPGGLTIVETGAGTCSSIDLVASSTTLTVTSLNPLTVAEGTPVTLRVTQSPSRCLRVPFATKYVVDQPDRARTTGMLNDDGVLELQSAVAGPLVVTAYAGGRTDSVTIDVKVRIVDTTGVPPDVTGTTFRNDFYDSAGKPRAGSAASTATWLYPYAATYFPLGLLPPVIQYKYSTAGDPGGSGTPAVRLSLRYPAGSTYDDAAFDYALVLTETNSVHRGIGKSAAKDPQLVIPPAGWDAFEETARGNDVTLSIERRRSDGTLEAPVTRNVHFVNGQLKGTVLYNSYNSTIAGSTTDDVIGGVLRIAPGEQQPTVAVPATAGKCSVCHTVSSSGSTMVLASGDTVNGSACESNAKGSDPTENYRGNSCSFDLLGPMPDEIASYPKTFGNQYNFVWSALYPDGSFALTNAWNNMGSSGDRFLGTTPQGSDYRSSSKLVQINGQRLESSGIPNMAVTPSFSHDGRKVAFNPSKFSDVRRDITLSEIGSCERLTPGNLVISEVSACRSFANVTGYEAVEIRNDTTATLNLTNYTIRGGSDGTVACSPAWTVNVANCGATSLNPGASMVCTRASSTQNCLLDGGGRVQLYDSSAAAVASTRTSTYNDCTSSGARGVLPCDQSWVAGAASSGASTDINDHTNDTCGLDWLEIRNDTGQDVNLDGWGVQAAGNLCLKIPNDTTIARGGTYRAHTNLVNLPNCIPNNGGLVQLYDPASNLIDSRNVTATCTPAMPRHDVRACDGSWSQVASGTNSTGNDSCIGIGGDYQSVAYSGDAAGTSLAVMDFSCGAAGGSVSCGAATKTFSNRKTVASHTRAVGYPSFLPDNAGVVFQRVVNDSGFAPSESTLNSVYGGAAEIWLTSATNTSATGPFAPIRLNALNGYNANGTYLQTTVPRDVMPAISNYDNNWHSSTRQNVGWHSDQCFSSTLNTDSVAEGELNYFPTASPQEAGDKYWVLFTSRRLYGNVATSSPWQAERSNNSNNRFGPYNSSTCNNAYGPASGLLETKKLWISAVDKDWQTSGGDPSHPAFYLPGQELQAGNSHAYWVATPCAKQNEACSTNDDCCGGTGMNPTNQCRIMQTTPSVVRQCQPKDSCSRVGQQCSASIACCEGLDCQAGSGTCVEHVAASYEPQTFEREYIGQCPGGLHPKWLEFGWKATLPTGSSIDFQVQTRPDEDSAYEPPGKIFLGSAQATTPPDSWDSAEETVDDLLVGWGLVSQEYLLLTMTFKPDEDGQVAPTLNDWRMIYDCVPAE